MHDKNEKYSYKTPGDINLSYHILRNLHLMTCNNSGQKTPSPYINGRFSPSTCKQMRLNNEIIITLG